MKKKRKPVSMYLLPEKDEKLSRLADDKAMSKGRIVEGLLDKVKDPKITN